MNIVSWNTNRRRDVAAQVAFLRSRAADIVALQEVTAATAPQFTSALTDLHYDVRSTVNSDSSRSGPRAYGVLIASRFAMQDRDDTALTSPWPEKVLSVVLQTPQGPMEIHSAHVPPGSSNHWTKVEVLESIYRGLAVKAQRPRILCGDFNCPQAELPTGDVITWAQQISPAGVYRMRRLVRGGPGYRWDQAERNVLIGLSDFGLRDAYRTLHGYTTDAASWYVTRAGQQVGRRFDHICVSPSESTSLRVSRRLSLGRFK